MIGLNLAKVSGTPVIEDGHSPCFVNPANSKENIAMSYMWLIGFKFHGTSLPHLTLKLSFRIYYSYIKLHIIRFKLLFYDQHHCDMVPVFTNVQRLECDLYMRCC